MTTHHELVIFKNHNPGLFQNVRHEDKEFRLAFAVKETVRAYSTRENMHCVWPAPWDVAGRERFRNVFV